jgi:hypothetical protein
MDLVLNFVGTILEAPLSFAHKHGLTRRVAMC